MFNDFTIVFKIDPTEGKESSNESNLKNRNFESMKQIRIYNLLNIAVERIFRRK